LATAGHREKVTTTSAVKAGFPQYDVLAGGRRDLG
jgi:hypothetical protein